MHLETGDPPAASLALVAGVALDEALAERVPAGVLQLKWPNDLLARGAKLAGILLERAGDAVVIGFGVNLAAHPAIADRPATSLPALGAAPLEPQAAVEMLADSFARWFERWRREGLERIRRHWLQRAHPVGTALAVRPGEGDQVESGLFDGLEPDGALRLRLADGGLRVIRAADVHVLAD